MNNRNGEEGSVNESLFIFVQFHKMLPFGRNIEQRESRCREKNRLSEREREREEFDFRGGGNFRREYQVRQT